MKPSLRLRGGIMGKLMGVSLLAVVGLAGYVGLQTQRTIEQLLGQNKILLESIENLTREDQIGYAKVLEQREVDGQLMTRVLFVVTDREDKSRRVLEREYEIVGDVVHFDALIVKFSTDLVKDGRERALYLWRRVYGEHTAPGQGQPIEVAGAEPARYEDLLDRLSIDDRELFWSEIWQLSDDPERLAHLGVTAIYGNAIYKKLEPGLIYAFKLGADGQFFPESYPDL